MKKIFLLFILSLTVTISVNNYTYAEVEYTDSDTFFSDNNIDPETGVYDDVSSGDSSTTTDSNDTSTTDSTTDSDSTSTTDSSDSSTTDSNSNPNCGYDVDNGDLDVGTALDGCLNGSTLVSGSDVSVDGGGFADKIINWVDNISIYLGVLAVGSIVYGALIMTLSAGEDEKITKAKNIIKWGLLGFIGLVSAAAVINIIVSLMYSL